MELPSIHAVTRLTCMCCICFSHIRAHLGKWNMGWHDVKYPPELPDVVQLLTYCSHFTIISGGCNNHWQKCHFTLLRGQWSAPACEGCWDSVQTPCPMVRAGRAAGLSPWQLGQTQGRLLGPGCSWTQADTRGVSNRKLQKRHDNLQGSRKVDYTSKTLLY